MSYAAAGGDLPLAAAQRASPVLAVEVDHLVRARVGSGPARLFLRSLTEGEHSLVLLTAGLHRRAVEIDAQYTDLDLGVVDASVMAIAERHDLPVFTFDFAHFRATRAVRGHWQLVVNEAQYAEAVDSF